ncbi:MAG: thioredoxin [Ndongobacter sp.]|nr:thioredoxin [Ndongobacter sp.]
MARQIDQKQFQDEVLNGEGVVLVDFFATWCGPCKMLTPILEQISDELKGVRILSVDVDEERALAEQYSIFSVPTMMIFKNGVKVDQMVGLMPKERIIEKINYYNN